MTEIGASGVPNTTKTKWDKFLLYARPIVSLMLFAYAIVSFFDDTYAKTVCILLTIMVLENIDDRRLRRERNAAETRAISE